MDFITEPQAAPGRVPLTVIAAPAAQADAETAARIAGLPVLATLDWATASDAEAPHLAGPVLVEAEGVPEAVLLAVLPGIAEAAALTGAAVIATLGIDQIDLVSAFLFGPRVELLVDADLARRVLALAIAGSPVAGAARDPAGGDGSRVADLSDEVARIAEMLAEVARRGAAGRSVGDRKREYRPPAGDELSGVTAAELRGVIRARRLRDELFGPGWFEDPAWDMLLDLFAAELEGIQVSISSLCIAAAVASTTALRQIGKMAQAGLLDRQPDPADRRRVFMQLSPAAREGMARYFAAGKRAGLPVA